MDIESRILIVGHNDVIENGLLNYFQQNGYSKIFSSSALFLDTLDQAVVKDFFEKHQPQYVFLSSVRSGGIVANQNMPAEFIYSNLVSEANIIHSAYTCGVKKLIYFSGSCAYPKESPQPIKEEYLLTGALEPTSEPFAVAKIAGVKMCQAYRKQYGFNAIVAVPSTVYGAEGEVNMETAHVIGALMAKFAEAVQKGKDKVVVWGTGAPRREFLYVDDFVEGVLFLMDRYEDGQIINLGCGDDISIKDLAELMAQLSGFGGKITYDTTKPDGVMQKLMDNSRITDLGWKAKVDLKEGIRKAYTLYTSQCNG